MPRLVVRLLCLLLKGGDKMYWDLLEDCRKFER